MAKQLLVRAGEKKVLAEILVRVKALQDAFDENEIKTILLNLGTGERCEKPKPILD